MNTSNLFPGSKNVDTVHLVDYLEWIANPEDQNHGLIALPPIQRSPVWKPVQVVDLWDSLLRGMPVGSFIVARMKEGEPSRSLDAIAANYKQTVENPPRAGFFLIDGQQRTLAALLGYHEFENSRARLWLDLGQSGKRGRAFSLRLTTESQPFGYEPNDPERKLTAREKHEAREKFYEKTGYKREDYKFDYKLPIKDTLPWKAVLPVPIIELWQAWHGRSNHGDSWWKRATQKYGNPESADVNIVKQLYPAFERLDSVMLPFILVPDEVIGASHHHQDVVEEDVTETLFQRIGRGGTPLAGEELIFSLIKHRWPKAHDVVHDLYADEKIGQLLEPTQIVMTAVRLVRADLGKEDVPRPSVNEFRRWLAEPADETDAVNTEPVQAGGLQQTPLLARLRELVVGPDSDPNTPRLQAAFLRFRKLIDYRPGNEPGLDPGLPKPFLPHLSLPAIQIVLRWIDLNRYCDSEFFEHNRSEVLRFLLFWHAAVYNDDKATKAAFNKIEQDNFPGRLIYQAITRTGEIEQPLAHRLPCPKLLHEVLGKPTSCLRTWPERFSPERQQGDAGFAVPFLQKWWNAKTVLLWLQRAWVDKWFEGYDPLAGRDADTPFDYDHILPRDHWLYCNADGELSNKKNDPFHQRWNRDLIGNAIGNYRVWPSELNRSEGANSPRSKLHLELKDDEFLDGSWPDYRLNHANDLLAACAINNNDKDLWLKASGKEENPKTWSYERIEAFQTVIEKRVGWLYERFYEELGFVEWEREK